MAEDLAKSISLIARKPDERQILLRTIVHELRSPLLTIRMGCDLLEKSLGPEAENHDVLNYIRQASRHLETMVTNLVETGRLVGGLSALTCRQEGLDRIIADAITALNAESAARQVPIERTGASGLSAWIDPDKLRQALLNVLENALLASSASQSVTINVREDSPSDRIIIDVVDRGSGLSEQQQEMAFQWYYALATRKASGGPGLGLGLALSREFIERMGGSIALKSKSNQGTTVSIQLRPRQPTQ